jgi:hypothetical protein
LISSTCCPAIKGLACRFFSGGFRRFPQISLRHQQSSQSSGFCQFLSGAAL